MANTKIQSEQIEDDIALGGNPTTTTQSAGNNTTRVATTAFVTTAVANLVDSAPSALDTLNELAAAMGDDANFSTTVTNSIATKLPLAGGTMTGNLEIDVGSGTNAGITLRMGTGSSGANDSFIGFENSAGTEVIRTRYDNPTTSYVISSDTSGDIVTVQRGGNVGIGSSSPTTLTEIRGTVPTLTLSDSQSKTWASGDDIAKISFFSRDPSGIGAHETGFILNENKNNGASLSGELVFGSAANNTAAAESMRLDKNGQLLHGTDTVPTGVLLGRQLVSSSATGAEIIAFREDAAIEIDDLTGAFLVGNSDTSGTEDHFAGMYGKASDVYGRQDLHFVAGRDGYEGDTPQMTLDNSGNFLVGKTVTTQNTAGTAISPTLGVRATVDQNVAAILNRTTDDGDIVLFRKDGSTVGSLGTVSNTIFLGSPSGAGKYAANNGNFSPTSDGDKNLGDSSLRWQDAHISRYVIAHQGAFLGGNSSSNYLEEYEEGTLTFGSISGHTNVTGTPTQEYALYTKVGNLIHIQARFSVNPTSTGQTAIHMTTPFAMHSASNVGLIGLVTAYATATNNACGYIIDYTGANDSQIYIETNVNSTAATAFTVQLTYRTS